MIVIGNTVISDDLGDQFFVCELSKCKGACCVEGDLGAPLEDEELKIVEEVYSQVEPYMSEEGKKAVDEQGFYIEDWEGDYSTPTIKDRECAYAFYDKKGFLKCAFEQAYNEGKIPFKKPLSCHLYPVRIQKLKDYEAVNYDRWHICKDACHNGRNLGVPLYRFLKEPLVRKYGEEWYKELVVQIEGQNSK